MSENKHPIDGIMFTAMQSIKEMIDVNTIVGDAVQTPDGTVIIPISKVGLGFGVGGSELMGKSKNPDGDKLFAGGTGGGVSISPVAFLVVGNGKIKLLPVNPESTFYDRILDTIPTAIDKISDGIKSIRGNKFAKSRNTYDEVFEEYKEMKARENSETDEPPYFTEMAD